MRKLLVFSMVSLVALTLCAVSGCTEMENDDTPVVEYVDLGLTSGTKWKSVNEDSLYHDLAEALDKFGDKMPTQQQMRELIAECTWTWVGDGYRVAGPNGKSITLPAAGLRDPNGNEFGIGTRGRYWSSTYFVNGGAALSFQASHIDVINSSYNDCYSVRLVED